MSLINDALKKAQRQRTGESPPLASMPGVGGESPARIAKRAKPVGFNALLLRAGLGAGVLLVLLVIGGYFALRKKPGAGDLKPEGAGARPAVTQPARASEPAASAASFTLPIAPPAPVAESPAPAAEPPAPAASPAGAKTPPPAPSTAGAAATSPPASPAGVPPAVVRPPSSGATAAPPLPAPGAAPVAPKMDGKAVGFIENLRIAGIRASTTDSKVLMNDRVYRVGDMVEHELGLKLIGITSNSLSFEDEHGARYTRNF